MNDPNDMDALIAMRTAPKAWEVPFKAEDRLLHGAKPAVKCCIWDYLPESGFHVTECGKEYFFDLGRIRDDQFKYCPFCGGAITAM